MKSTLAWRRSGHQQAANPKNIPNISFETMMSL